MSGLPGVSQDERHPLPQCLTRAACLLLAPAPEGWVCLYCAQGRWDAADTCAYLQQYYPDGLLRLREAGCALAGLGAEPALCPVLMEPGEGPDLPAVADLHEAVDYASCCHPVVNFVVVFAPQEGHWHAYDITLQTELA